MSSDEDLKDNIDTRIKEKIKLFTLFNVTKSLRFGNIKVLFRVNHYYIIGKRQNDLR